MRNLESLDTTPHVSPQPQSTRRRASCSLVDAHRSDDRRFVVRSDELLSAFSGRLRNARFYFQRCNFCWRELVGSAPRPLALGQFKFE